MPYRGNRPTLRVRGLLLVVAFLVAVLSFGQPLAAYAEPTGSSSGTASPEAKPTDPASAGAPETPSESPSGGTSAEPTATPTATSSRQPSETPGAPSPTPSDSATPASTAKEAAVRPQVVPPATGNNAVITVKVGGNRQTQTAVGGLAGVQLGFYAAQTGGTALFTCMSDADGDCSVTVPNTQVGGANRDARYWVREIAPAPGHYSNPNLGGSTDNTLAYRFQTGTQLRAGTVYSSSADFMIATGTSDTASGGIWQNSLDNPTFPAKCGVTVALVLDLSGSVAPSLSQLKNAANAFVSSLGGTPSSVGVFTFATTAPAAGATNTTLAPTPVSTAAGVNTVTTKINGLTIPTGNQQYTNWDRGLYQVAQSASSFDVTVVITDGNPTVYGTNTSPVQTRFRETENGIFSANAVKAKSTKVLAVGVGDGVSSAASGLNLRAISGPVLNTDYYQTANYAQAAAQLKALALGNCVGSISVVKEVVPSTTASGSTVGAQPQGGWDFTGLGATGVTFDAPTTRTTAVGTGAANFPLTFAGGTTAGTVTLTEAPQSGYTLHQGVAGKNAVCTRIDTGAAVSSTNVTNGFTVSANEAYPISCTVYNKAPAPLASVVVNKQWVINGTTYAEGSQPSNFVAGLTIAGTDEGWGVERTGFRQGDQPVIDEGISNVPIQCTVDSRRVVLANNTTIDEAVPYTPTLLAGENDYTIRNVVTCETKLTLAKSVEGGTEPVTSWDLDAVAPDNALPGPSGTSGSDGATGQAVTPGVTYPLAETGTTTGALDYTQFVAPTATLIPGSTGSWTCQEVGTDGTTVIPGFSDGLNGGVTVPLGKWVRCTAVNRTATLILDKIVQNTHGGTAVPADWTLSATPTGTFLPGLPVQSVTGSTAGTPFNIRPGVSYTVSESDGPAGYTLASTVCDTAPGDTNVVSITPAPLDTITCTLTNVDNPAKLTLKKTVTNDDGGTASPTDWTLAADGPTPISGATGSTAVTDATVDAGTYALSESGGPTGYTAGTWSCTGGTVTGSSVTVANGADVTCTIDNDDQPAQLTLVKTVDNGLTGATSTPADFTLTAAGPSSTVTGPGGSAQVTDQTVPAGTYALTETGPDGYTASAWTCVGATVSAGPAQSVTVPNGGTATCTITNTAQQPTLTLVKKVVNDNGGTAAVTDWTLTGDGATPLDGVSGSPAVTAVDVMVGDYALAESGGPGGYTQGLWTCVDGNGTTIPVTGDSVGVALGQDVTCTITNDDQPAELTLVKDVAANETGSTKKPADWTLTADPQGITGQQPVSGNGDPTSSGGVQAVEVSAGTYELSESGPAGFTGSVWECTGGVVSGDLVTIANGGNVTCTITNTAIAPRLTLVKQVVNDNGGTAQPTDWTLSAAGPSPITGATGDPAVTDAAVQVGSYTLDESGPPDYTASAWSCVDADQNVVPVAKGSVALAEGDDVTCTIVNDDNAPSWSIIKVSDPASGSTVQPGSEITYVVGLIRNPGVDPHNVVVTDDLSNVLNHATLVDGPVTAIGTASITGTTLTWTVPVLDQPIAAVGYTVRVDSDAYGVTLKNVATSPGSSPCQADDLADLSAQRLSSRALAVGPTAFTRAAASPDDALCPTTTTHKTPPKAQPPVPPAPPNLPNTGGPGLLPLGLGLGFVIMSGLLLRASRRRRLAQAVSRVPQS